MNLYKHLLNKDNQTIFCESLLKTFPELLEYDVNNHIDNYCRIFPNRISTQPPNRVSVGLCNKDDTTSYYNIFDIVDSTIDDWRCWDSKGVLYDMCHVWKPNDGRKDLRIPIKNWCVEYERTIQREKKLNRIVCD